MTANPSPSDRIELVEKFFDLTQAGARRRRWTLLLLGGALWGLAAYLLTLPPPQVYATLGALFSLFNFLLDLRVFIVLLVMLVCVQGIVLITLVLTDRPIWKPLYWLPSILAAGLVLFKLLWGPYLAALQWDSTMAMGFLAYWPAALFGAEVMQFVLLVALSFWVAYYTAAVFLDDIYELNDISVARRFVRQAVFGSQFNQIDIKGGDVAQAHKDSTILRIGGPGWVRVHLDNAALFEAVDGTPRVIGPTVDKPNQREVLAGFERLRGIIDLTDKIEKFDVEGRTLDGIRITLKEVTAVFSVYRGGQPATLTRPYPFDPLAVRRLIYGQGTTNWAIPVTSLIRRRFGEFISRHTLSEFLAATGQPEADQQQREQDDLQRQFSGLGAMPNTLAAAPMELASFRTRPDMLTALFAEEFADEAARRGVEIKWIGGGTWDLTDRVVPQRHLEAWKLSRENLLRGSPGAMDAARLESQYAEQARLVQDALIQTYQQVKDQPPATALRKLLIAYDKLLGDTYDQLQSNPDDPALLEWLRQVRIYLKRYTARWLGGP